MNELMLVIVLMIFEDLFDRWRMRVEDEGEE